MTTTTQKIQRPTLLTGLSEAEAQRRAAAGQANTTPDTYGETTWRIVRRHALSFINILLFAISVGLIILGLYRDAVLTAGIVLINVVVGIVQELRARRQLARIAILNRPTATVIRDGRRREIDPAGIVVGDSLLIEAGDQIPVDAVMRGDGELSVDESNVTGESDRITKRQGDLLMSGSVCLAGSAICETLRVGEDAAAQRVTAQARAYRNVKTPLQREVGVIIQAMTVVVALLAFEVVTTMNSLYGGLPIVETAQASAVLVALVPQGLVLMITVSYSLAVLRIAPQGALIQRVNAVESLSHTDILCVDKTGTLTTQNLEFDSLQPFGIDEGRLRGILGDFIASSPSANRTSEAIGAACPGQMREVSEEIAFSSEWKWSGLSFDEPPGTYVLGAPEVLLPAFQDDCAGIEQQLAEQTARGMRVLLFAGCESNAPLRSGDDPHLPGCLQPLALVSLRDELRPGVEDTIRSFTDIGISLKVISGDNPDTVLALARQAGFPESSMAIAGRDLQGLAPEKLARVAEQNTVFGRVTPEQKEMLVKALEGQGHWVAMTGDGVNDILALKEARIGIAMRSGSEATRAAADIVLMNDSFDVLPPAFAEGQRVMRGMTDNIKLFLTRTLSIVFLIFFASLIDQEFPITPSQNSIMAMLTVGIPAFALALWARPGHTPRNLWRLIVQFVLPAALMVSIISIAVYDFFLTLTGGNVEWSQAAVTTTLVSTLLLIVLFAQPPSTAWVGASSLNGDRRPLYLVIGMYATYAVILLVPTTRRFFELQTLPWSGYVMLAFIVIGWVITVRHIWRKALGDRIWAYGESGLTRLSNRLNGSDGDGL